MTSFIANTFALIAHKPETVTAVFAVSREIMNSSICPVTLSNNEVWDLLSEHPFGSKIEYNLLLLFSNFSDTLQFTEKLRFRHIFCDWDDVDPGFVEHMLKKLIKTKRYFCRTIKHIDFPTAYLIPQFSKKLKNIKSIGLQLLDLDLEYGGPEFLAEHMKIICNSFPFLKKLDISGKVGITSKGMQHLNKLKLLEELDFSCAYVSSLMEVHPMKHPFLIGMKSLKKLDLSNNNIVQDYTLNFSGTTSKKKKTVNDDDEEEDDDDYYNNYESDDDNADSDNDDELLDPALPSLIDLNVRNCGGIGQYGSVLGRFQKHAPNLTSLECSREICYFTNAKSVSKMKYLRKLKMSANLRDQAETVKSIEVLSMKLEMLEVWRIVDASDFNNECIKHISSTSSPLRKLHIESDETDELEFTDEGFRHLTALEDLESLAIINNENRHFTGYLGKGRSLSSALKELDFCCSHVTVKGLKSIVMNKMPFITLHFAFCRSLTSKGLAEILRGSKSSLTLLDVTDCPLIDDLSFLDGLVSLKELDLSYTNIKHPLWGDYHYDENGDEVQEKNGERWKGTMRSCSKLEVLQLGGTLFSDDEIGDLPENVLNNLTRLTLRDCSNLTTGLLEYVGITWKLPRLKFLNLTKFPGLTTDHLLRLVNKLPCLGELIIDKGLVTSIEKDKKLNMELGRVVYSE